MIALGSSQTLRPAEICSALLAALEASEGRRRKRKRDQTPDAAGLAIKRSILEAAIAADPAADQFEAWLLSHAASSGVHGTAGAATAMARAIFEEWRLAHSLVQFRAWLAQGAPSEDSAEPNPPGRTSP